MKNPFITNHIISQDSSEFEFKISTSEVSRISRNLNIKYFYQRPKEKLNQNQKIYRYNFSFKIQSSEIFSFPLVLSDESIIALEPMKKQVKIIPSIENSKYYFEKQGYPPHIMIWGCIAKDFKSHLIRIDIKLKSKDYIEMFEQNKIIELLNGRFGEKSYVFQQDGAPAHRANKIRGFLYDKVKMFLDDLYWPVNSPDLNVIEHQWGIIKSKIDLTNVTNLDELFIQVQNQQQAANATSIIGLPGMQNFSINVAPSDQSNQQQPTAPLKDAQQALFTANAADASNSTGVVPPSMLATIYCTIFNADDSSAQGGAVIQTQPPVLPGMNLITPGLHAQPGAPGSNSKIAQKTQKTPKVKIMSSEIDIEGPTSHEAYQAALNNPNLTLSPQALGFLI